MPSAQGHYLKELTTNTGNCSIFSHSYFVSVFQVILKTSWNDLNSCHSSNNLYYISVSSISAWAIQTHLYVLYVLGRQWLSTSAMRMCHCCFLVLQSILLEVSNTALSAPNKIIAIQFECCWNYLFMPKISTHAAAILFEMVSVGWKKGRCFM